MKIPITCLILFIQWYKNLISRGAYMKTGKNVLCAIRVFYYNGDCRVKEKNTNKFFSEEFQIPAIYFNCFHRLKIRIIKLNWSFEFPRLVVFRLENALDGKRSKKKVNALTDKNISRQISQWIRRSKSQRDNINPVW